MLFYTACAHVHSNNMQKALKFKHTLLPQLVTGGTAVQPGQQAEVA